MFTRLKRSLAVCAVWIGGASVVMLAAPPVVAITNLVQRESGVELRWHASSPELHSILESRDSIQEEAWSPVPGGQWPAPTRSFLDARPPSSSRFYRVRGQPGPVARGTLLSSTELASMTREQIQFFFTLAGFPVVADRGVKFYKLQYETVDAQGLRTLASGALAVPVGLASPLPLVSYQHGSILSREDVPSRLNTEGFLGVAFATSGYAAVLPDYQGLGDSPGFHPYHHADSEAAAVIDMLRAARAFCAAAAIPLGPRLFLTGYSQGGHATLAALREMESRHADEFTVTACATGAGAYDLSGTTANDFLSRRAQPNPYYFVYLLAAYRDVYGLPDYLAEPYATTVPPLLDGTHDGAAVNAILPSDPTLILSPGDREAFLGDPQHPLRIALRRNDLLDWAPRTPVRLYHCNGDRDVAPANSTVARDAFVARGAAVELFDPSPAADHGGCVEPTLLQIKAWFDVLRN